MMRRAPNDWFARLVDSVVWLDGESFPRNPLEVLLCWGVISFAFAAELVGIAVEHFREYG